MYILYDCEDGCIFLASGDREYIKKKANAYIRNLNHPATRQVLQDISEAFGDLPDVGNIADTMVKSLTVIEVHDEEVLSEIINTAGYLSYYVEEYKPLNLIDGLLDRDNLECISVDELFSNGGNDNGNGTF